MLKVFRVARFKAHSRRGPETGYTASKHTAKGACVRDLSHPHFNQNPHKLEHTYGKQGWLASGLLGFLLPDHTSSSLNSTLDSQRPAWGGCFRGLAYHLFGALDWVAQIVRGGCIWGIGSILRLQADVERHSRVSRKCGRIIMSLYKDHKHQQTIDHSKTI